MSTAKRMRTPISKKIRFDVFKRDAFTCQYCGGHPPAMVLEVDHIDPVANGGGNDIDNLITACFNCNRGKAATSLNVIPQSLSEKATQVSERESQVQGYHDVLEAKRERLECQAWDVLDACGVDRMVGCSKDQFHSTKMFVEKLGFHQALEAMEIASAAKGGIKHCFKYFCGVCWNKLKKQGGE